MDELGTHDLGEEVTAWLAEHFRRDLPKAEWLAMVVDAGYAVPTWPVEWYGRGAGTAQAAAIGAAFASAGAPGARQDRHNLWANTLLAFGSETLKRELIRPLLLDQVTMCLLYSEPEAGSDLAGLRTTARRDGDGWVVTGQKVWTSNATKADYGMLVARTDWSLPKHAGISFFFLPMRQPGIEIRPIRQITGESLFTEVFIDGAVVPEANLLGGLNGGWRVLQTALAYERSVMGDMARGPRRKAGQAGDGKGADIDLAAIARRYGVAADPVIRQAITTVHTLRAVNRWNNERGKAALRQGSSSPVLSLGKLAMSRILHTGAAVLARIVGAEAMLDGEEHPDGAAAGFLALNAYFTSIGGGTDEIQRNIIGERLLGLPKEPEVDRDLPFETVVSAIR